MMDKHITYTSLFRKISRWKSCKQKLRLELFHVFMDTGNDLYDIGYYIR